MNAITTESLIASVRSFVPGRLRLRHPALAELSDDLAEGLVSWLKTKPGMKDVTLNRRVGSLLLLWDESEADWTFEELAEEVAGLFALFAPADESVCERSLLCLRFREGVGRDARRGARARGRDVEALRREGARPCGAHRSAREEGEGGCAHAPRRAEPSDGRSARGFHRGDLPSRLGRPLGARFRLLRVPRGAPLAAPPRALRNFAPDGTALCGAPFFQVE